MSKISSSSEHKLHTVAVTVHRKPACRIELEVNAPPELVSAAKKEAARRVSKEVTLPGFRKGKAPLLMIERKFPNQIEAEWQKAIADAAFASAQLQERVPVLQTGSPVTFDMKEFSPEAGAKIIFTFETEPAIPHIDPKLFAAKPVEKAVVDEKKINEAVRQMLFFYAKWKAVEDRGVQEGDTIVIDLDTLDGGEPQKVFNHVRFEVSEARMAEWMKRLVIGAKAGDVLEGTSEPDANATEEEKKEFSPKQVRLTLIKVEEATLPELDDEFARKVGAQDMAALRSTVEQILQKTVDDKYKEQRREQVTDFLIQTYAFELPLSLIDTERQHRKNQLLSDPKRKEQYLALSTDEKKKLDDKFYDEASQAVRLFYLSRQVVRQANIPITQSEVQNEAVHSAGAFGKVDDPAKLPKEVYALALSKVILAKAQDYILEESAKYTDHNSRIGL